jgi:general secretion pathway protein K
MKTLQQQRGVALVVAIMVVAIAVVLASTLVERLHLDIRRSENLLHGDQAYLYTLGSEIIATTVLKQDNEKSKYDALDENWASESTPIPVEGGQVIGQLRDLQGCFNLNNLSPTLNEANHAADVERFRRLLSALQLPPTLADAVTDWLDADMETRGTGGAEDDFYMSMTPPYRAANGPITSTSELRMVRGFNDPDAEEDIYAKLEPYVCALPIATTININTAPDMVLKSLANDLSDADIQQIILRRPGEEGTTDKANAQPFKTLDEFKTFMQSTLNKPNFNTQGLSVSSNYFLLRSVAQIGNTRSYLSSVLQRDNNGACQVIGRTQGAW